MNKLLPSFYNKVKAAVLLLCLFFMMVGTCPIKRLLSNASSPPVETTHRPNNHKDLVHVNFHCPSGGKIIQATLFDLTKAGNNGFSLPFFLNLLSFYLFASILKTGIVSITTSRIPSLIGSVPLFLKNRSIII